MPHTTPAVNSILQASILSTLASTVKDYIFEHSFKPFEDYQGAYMANKTKALGLNSTHTLAAHGPEWTETASASTPDEEWSDTRLFLLSELPKTIVAIVLITTLRYWWLIWLERLLPARPRPRAALTAPAAGDREDDSREEEVIRKWIEAGKVRRASLSWFNTFAKWVLDLTVWNLFVCLLWAVIVEPAMQWTYPWTKFSLLHLSVDFTINFFGIAPLVTLVGFILVPAHKRIVFEEGVDLAWQLFFGAFLSVMMPWAMEKEFAQEFARSVTDSMIKGEKSNVTTLAVGLDGDEL